MALANPVINPNFTYDAVGTAPFAWVASYSGGTSLEDFAVHSEKLLHAKATHSATTTSEEFIAFTKPEAYIPVVPGQIWTLSAKLNIIVPSPLGFQWRYAWYKADKTTVLSEENVGAGLAGLGGAREMLGTGKEAPAEAAYLRYGVRINSSSSGFVFWFYMNEVIGTLGSVSAPYVDGDTEGYEWAGSPGKSVTNTWNYLNHPGAILPSGPQLSTKYTLTGPDGSVATFNDQFDPNYVGAITEVTGLDSPEVRENGENITGMDGGVHGNFYHGRRPITMSGTIFNVISNEDRNRKITKLLQASNAMREDSVLEWTPEGGERQFLKVRRQQPVRVTGGFAKDFQLSLVAADPKIYSTAVSTATANDTVMSTKNYITTAGNPGGVACNKEFVFWANVSTGFIGKATLKGGSIASTFIKTASQPNGIAIDGEHIYWADSINKSIGRATLAGGTIETAWIKLTNSPVGVAVDAGHVYWGHSTGNTIGRATIAGATVEESFITGANDPQGVTVDGTYIYWANRGGTSIGRALLAGTSVEQNWISGVTEPCYPCLDPNGELIYWCCYSGNTVSKANINGTEVEKNYAMLNTGPYGLAVSTEINGIYVAGYNAGAISVVPIRVPAFAATNNGSEISYPVFTLSGKIKGIGVVNKTTGEEIALNYEPDLPVAFSGGLKPGISYVANDGTYFYYVSGNTSFGKIGITGTANEPNFGLLFGATPSGYATNASTPYTYLACLGSSNKYDIFRVPKGLAEHENAMLVASTEAETFVSLGANETALFFGNQAKMQTCTLTGTGLTTIITAANVGAGSQIYATATNIYWTNTSGAIMKATVAGASVATVVAVPTHATSITADATHIYWTASSTGCIGRCTLTGTEIEPEWITGLSEPRGVFVNSERVYWVNSLVGTLGYRNLAEPEITVTIDMLNRTVTQLNGASMYGSVNFAETDWFGFIPGINELGVVASSVSEVLSINAAVTYRSAWI
jgi:hypothetical protein